MFQRVEYSESSSLINYFGGAAGTIHFAGPATDMRLDGHNCCDETHRYQHGNRHSYANRQNPDEANDAEGRPTAAMRPPVWSEKRRRSCRLALAGRTG